MQRNIFNAATVSSANPINLFEVMITDEILDCC